MEAATIRMRTRDGREIEGSDLGEVAKELRVNIAPGFKSRRPKTRPDPEMDAAADKACGAAAAELRQFVERVERLEAEKRDIADGIGEVYAEAKGRGYDVKALRHIVKLRRLDRDALAEFEAVVDTYRAALGI